MASPKAARRLIVNADDFGRSHSINQAVVRAHREGILTSASLMVNETASEEAAALARENPQLGVGLHLTLVCGSSASLPAEIPGLADPQGRFSDNPFSAGLRYFLRPSLRSQLAAEIAAQFAKFAALGLPLDHVNGHLHLHMHPAVLGILTHPALQFRLTKARLTRDEFCLNARLAPGRWLYRLSHAFLFALLAAHARSAFRRLGIRHTDRVFGLLQDSRVDEEYLSRLLRRLPPGDSELYSHPSLDKFKREFEALISPQVKRLVHDRNIHLIRYCDL